MAEEKKKALQVEVQSSREISRKLLKECFGIEPTKVEAKWKGSKEVGVLGCHRYRCSFDLANNVEKFMFVVDRFCKMFEGDAHIRADPLLADLEEVEDSDHNYRRVEHFALGTWTGLSGFVEKFSSTRAKVGSRKIGRLQASFHHHTRFLEIHFEDRISGQKLGYVYKLKILYEDITKVVLKRELRHLDAFYAVNRRKEPMDVFLHVSKVTAYSWNDPDKNAYEWFFDGVWDRVPTFGAPGSPTYCGQIGAINVIKLKMESTGEAYPTEPIYALLATLKSRRSMYFANVKTLEMPKNAEPLTCDKGSPDVQCALACINSLSPELALKIALEQNRKEIQDVLTKLAAEDSGTLAEALYDMYYAIGNYPIVNMKFAIESSVKMVKEAGACRTVVTKERLPENLYLVKKTTVTPSRTIVEPPTAVRVNALLRNFDSDRVMLVDIRDDDKRKLRLRNSEEARTFVQKSIADRIRKGIKVAGKTFYFLGSSKLRAEDASFWAYAIDKKGSDTIDSVRERLGIEGDLKSRVAMQDLVFAEALGCVEIDPEWVTEESDSVPQSGDFKYGIGRISREALDFIIENCYATRQPCSAIRVFHGGRKGTLAYDPCLEGSRIVYRRSQVLYKSDDPVLYLTGISEIKQAVLDKVFISTLSSKLDQRREVFSAKDFLKPVYELLNDSLSPFATESQRDAALTEPLLAHIGNGKLSLERYDKSGDGLFRQAWRCRQLRALRDLKMLKERLKTAYELMPVVDEVGVLDEGEVFIQLCPTGNEFHVLDSAVVISRKDAMNPAELLRVNAVNRSEVVSALGHLTNCVVMPSRGRDKALALLTRKGSYAEDGNIVVIAGSSDGKSGFIFKKNDPPPQARMQLGLETEPDCDLDAHFFNYISYTTYNDFDEAFCALADSLPEHAYSENCLRVGLQRRFLDEYRRGGRELIRLPEVVRFPDFLGKISERMTYCSTRPLGYIFRKAKFIDVDYFENTAMDIDELTFQPDLELAGHEAYTAAAERDIAKFQQNLVGIASLYDVTIEEVLTGTIFSLREQRFSEERTRSLEATMKLHMKHLAVICKRQFKKGMKKASDENFLEKMSAYYIASRTFPEDGGYAFPWMIADQMERLIARCRPGPPPPRESALVDKLLATVRPDRDFKGRIMENIFKLTKKWIEVNKKICAISRNEARYFGDKLTELETSAFETAYCILESVQQKHKDVSESLQYDPLPLLAETLRQMMFILGETDDKKFSNDQFLMVSVQALLSNTMVRIAATSSLEVFVKPREILRENVISHRILLPICEKDKIYIRESQNNLQKMQTKLAEFSSCDKVLVRLLPKLETSDGDYEEIIGRGSWFAVANLEIIVMLPDFRSIFLQCLDADRLHALNLNADSD